MHNRRRYYFGLGLDVKFHGCCTDAYDITDLTPQRLRRAASIKEKLDSLNRELRSLLDGSS